MPAKAGIHDFFLRRLKTGDRLLTIVKWRRLIAPGIAAFIVFCLLIWLGIWQLHRLKWKEAILATIHNAEIAAPVPLPANPTPYEKVIIAGHWITCKAALYGDEVHDSPHGPIQGGELIMPFAAENGRIWLIDLGWVPTQTPTPLPMPTQQTNAVGYLHAPILPDYSSPKDDPAAELYYTLNPQAIGQGLGFAHVAPFTLITIGPMPPPGSKEPQPAQHLPTPPNNHYQYALEWFGFAGVLLFEFIFFARKRLLDP